MNLMDDRQIIALFLERSEQAVTELSSKYGTLCTRVATNILNDPQDAEECVNDAYLGVWNTVPPREPDPLVSYLFRIVRNLALKRYRHNVAAKRNSIYDVALDELEGCLAAVGLVEEALDARETARLINEFLATLEKEQRVLFVRRYWYADSIGELATLFDTSRHQISVRLSRIREKLKKHLIKEGVFV